MLQAIFCSSLEPSTIVTLVIACSAATSLMTRTGAAALAGNTANPNVGSSGPGFVELCMVLGTRCAYVRNASLKYSYWKSRYTQESSWPFLSPTSYKEGLEHIFALLQSSRDFETSLRLTEYYNKICTQQTGLEVMSTTIYTCLDPPP